MKKTILFIIALVLLSGKSISAQDIHTDVLIPSGNALQFEMKPGGYVADVVCKKSNNEKENLVMGKDIPINQTEAKGIIIYRNGYIIYINPPIKGQENSGYIYMHAINGATYTEADITGTVTTETISDSKVRVKLDILIKWRN